MYNYVMKYAVFDYDETLSKGMFFPDLLKNAEKSGIIKKGYSANYDKLWKKYEAEKITYEKFVMDSTSFTLEHLTGVEEIKLIKNFSESGLIKKRIFPWVEELFDILHKKDYLIIIVSATPCEVIEIAQESIDFDTFFATQLEVKKGKYTGKLKKLVNNHEKAKFVKSFIQNDDHTIGMGDSEGDVEMLKLLDNPFFYEPFDDTDDEAKLYNIPRLNRKNVISEIKKVLR